MKPAQTYKIETERLIIRCYEPGDAQPLHEAILISMPHLLPWIPWAPDEPKDLEYRKELVRLFRGRFDLGQEYVFAILDKATGEFIGGTGLHTRAGANAREIGYWISIKHISQGYATEVTKALTKVAFELEGMNRIEIRCDPQNTASKNIPQKLGYRLETILKNSANSPHGKGKTMVWTMSSREYAKSPIRNTRIHAFNFSGEKIVTTKAG